LLVAAVAALGALVVRGAIRNHTLPLFGMGLGEAILLAFIGLLVLGAGKRR
jgi:hypothetical protein